MTSGNRPSLSIGVARLGDSEAVARCCCTGVLLLETEEHAKARGAKIYCELAGYAATCDAHHITAPHPEGEGMADCLTSAMESAGVAPSDVQYINAHGTSTPLGDINETNAIKAALGDHAHKEIGRASCRERV